MTVLVESGSKVSRYVLIQLLGTGGMAEVWAAEDESLRRQVAVKIALPGLSEEPDFVRRFVREAQTAARLDHPHILPVHDVGMHRGRPFLVMPLLTGGRLSDKQAESVDGVLRWLRELASALDYAHSEGVVHRDVKPGNVLFDKRGRTLLADFGLAKSLEDGSIITQSGAVMGTPVYMAPEQAMGDPTLHPVLPASDQYALGMIAYRFVSGRLPFDVLSTPIVLMKKVSEELPLPSVYNPALNARVDAAFRSVLSKDPRKRFASCQDFVENLSRALVLEDSSFRSVPPVRAPGFVERTADVRPPTPASSKDRPARPALEARPLESDAPVETGGSDPSSPAETWRPDVPSEVPAEASNAPEVEPRRPPSRASLLVLTGVSLVICIAGGVFLARSFLGSNERTEPLAPVASPTAMPTTLGTAFPALVATATEVSAPATGAEGLPMASGTPATPSPHDTTFSVVTVKEPEKATALPDRGEAKQMALLSELARRATQGDAEPANAKGTVVEVVPVEARPAAPENPTLPPISTPVAREEPRANETLPVNPENALLIQVSGQLSATSVNLTFQFDRNITRPEGNVLKVERIIAIDHGVELLPRPWKSMECSAPRGSVLPCWIPLQSIPRSSLDAITPGASLEVMLTLGQRRVLKRAVLKGN